MIQHTVTGLALMAGLGFTAANLNETPLAETNPLAAVNSADEVADKMAAIHQELQHLLLKAEALADEGHEKKAQALHERAAQLAERARAMRAHQEEARHAHLEARKQDEKNEALRRILQHPQPRDQMRAEQAAARWLAEAELRRDPANNEVMQKLLQHLHDKEVPLAEGEGPVEVHFEALFDNVKEHQEFFNQVQKNAAEAERHGEEARRHYFEALESYQENAARYPEVLQRYREADYPAPMEGTPLPTLDLFFADGKRNAEREELERRLHHIHAAAENLHASGLHEKAEEILHEGRGIQEHLHDMIAERNVPYPEPGTQLRIDALEEQVHALRGEVREMREMIEELRHLLTKAPR